MATQPQPSRIIQAIEALKSGDRDGAVKMLEDELRFGPDGLVLDYPGIAVRVV